MRTTTAVIGALGTALALRLPCIAAFAQVPCRYEVEYLPNPSPCPFWERYIEPTGISPNGRYVCGWTGDCGTNELAVVVDTQPPGGGGMQMTIIPRPPGITSMRAYGVNDKMEVCGTMQLSPPTFFQRGFLWGSGQLTDLGVPEGATNVEANGINSNTQITGAFDLPTGRQAYRWSNGAFTLLNAPPDHTSVGWAIHADGRVAGHVQPNCPSCQQAFLWTGVRGVPLGFLPQGINFSIARSIGPSGEIAGWGALPVAEGASSRAFLYRNGNMWNLGLLPGATASRAYATNGLTTVGHCDIPNSSAAFVYTNNLMRRLEQLQPNPELVIFAANAVSNDGSIAASGRIGSMHYRMVLRPILTPQGDTSLDCRVNVSDLLQVINAWGPCPSNQPYCPVDLNSDGVVNHLDLLIVIQHWGQHS